MTWQTFKKLQIKAKEPFKGNQSGGTRGHKSLLIRSLQKQTTFN